MSRETQNVLLLLLGGAILQISIGGTFVRYVKPSLHPYLLASGFVIVTLAVAAIARDVRRGGPSKDEHEHSSKPYWMLLVPAAVILFVAPPALSVSALPDRGVTTEAVDRKTFPPLPDGDAPEVEFLDVVRRAAQDDSGSLDGREITVTGMRVVNPDGTVDIARVLIVCCAADARSIRIRLDRPVEGEWLRIRGTVAQSSRATGNVPTMTVTGVEQLPVPQNTYAY